MFIIVCSSTDRGSVRIACAGPLETQAKMTELADARVGKVRAFDAAGNRLFPEELASLAEASRRQRATDLPREAVNVLVAESLCGSDLDVDCAGLSLHDLSQLAASLRPGAWLTVRDSDTLPPIARASIASLMPGQVRFA